jgi:hypothetical protein
MHQLKSAQSAEPIASRGSAPSQQIVQMISPDATPAYALSDEAEKAIQDAVSQDEAESAAVRAMYFQRYTGQIDARIRRAWRRPRSSVNKVQWLGRVADFPRRGD